MFYALLLLIPVMVSAVENSPSPPLPVDSAVKVSGKGSVEVQKLPRKGLGPPNDIGIFGGKKKLGLSDCMNDELLIYKKKNPNATPQDLVRFVAKSRRNCEFKVEMSRSNAKVTRNRTKNLPATTRPAQGETNPGLRKKLKAKTAN